MAKFHLGKYLPILLMVSLISSAVEIEVVIPSLPNISDYFNISDNLTQMIIAINYLGYGISSIIYGPLSECYGRKKIMIIGNFIMCIGSFLCVFANDIFLLLGARFIQGIGSSTSVIVVFVILSDVYSGRQASKIIGRISSFLYTLVASAPIIGSVINDLFGWRGNYWIVAIISSITCISLILMLPETKNLRNNFSLIAMIKHYQNIFCNRNFLPLSLSLSTYNACYASFMSGASFLYIETFKLSPKGYSLHQASIILIFSITSMFVELVFKNLGERRGIIIFFSVSFIGMLMMFFMLFIKDIEKIEHIEYMVTFSVILFVIGEAIIYPAFFTKSLEIIPDLKGTISSSLSMSRSIISSLFVFIMGYFYNGSLCNVFVVLLIQGVFLTLFIFKSLKMFIYKI